MGDGDPKSTTDNRKRFEERWGKPLAQAGFTMIPNVLLEKQDALKLDAIDLNIILHLAKYWWDADSPPFPAKSTIAKAMGIKARTVQRRIAALEQAGYIRRESRRGADGAGKTNAYHLRGLAKSATPFALEVLDLKEKQKQERAEWKVRRRPNPKVPADDVA